MEFFLSHWHCIVPAAAILIGVLLLSRDKQKAKDKANHEGRANYNQDIESSNK